MTARDGCPLLTHPYTRGYQDGERDRKQGAHGIDPRVAARMYDHPDEYMDGFEDGYEGWGPGNDGWDGDHTQAGP